jgi:hypothetical protein
MYTTQCILQSNLPISTPGSHFLIRQVYTRPASGRTVGSTAPVTGRGMSIEIGGACSDSKG